jgi:hypothetical protein
MHDSSHISSISFEFLDLENKFMSQINKLVIIFKKHRTLKFTRDGHVWFINMLSVCQNL